MIKLQDVIRKYNDIVKVKICNQMLVVDENVKAMCGSQCKLVSWCVNEKMRQRGVIGLKELGKE